MGNFLDNIFGPGGFLGGAPGDTEAQKAQAELLLKMMGREGELYPMLQKLLGESRGNADAAYRAATGGVNEQYKGIQDDLDNLRIPPEALDALNNIRKTRLASLDDTTTKMVGSGVADLARRGVASSSTAEGLGGRVASAIAPQLGEIESDYSTALTSLPGEVASKRFGLGMSQAGLMSNAMRNKYQSILQPYLDMWKTSAGVGVTNPSVNKDPGQGGQNAMNIAKIAASF